MTEKFLDQVYGTSTDEKAQAAFYDRWAGSYDSELAENAYATPGRLARALAATETGADHRILDFGCGTGLSGEALVEEGYTLIDGTDLSAEMLAWAEAKQIYGRLWQTDPENPLPFAGGEYGVIVAVGVVSPGAAPAKLLSELADKLDSGGRFAFSYNDHALADDGYMDALGHLPDHGMTRLHEDYGDHLPGVGLGSSVYVYEKA